MRSRGTRAERRAARLLRRKGFAIVTMNYTCRFGEIDIVASKGELVVFVEVRLRASRDFGGALASVTTAKQRRLRLAAASYCQSVAAMPGFCRFDVVAFEGRHVVHVEGAFV